MLRTILISLFAGVIGSIIFMSIYNIKYEKQMGRVDVKSIMSKHLSEQYKKLTNEKIAKKRGAIFAQSLENSLKELSEKKGVILFVSGAVISGVPDYTEEVEQIIKEKMEDMK